MKLTVLTAALEQDTENLPERMHLACDAIIVNQCDKDGRAEWDYKGHKITVLNRAERGVGRSRNLALSEAYGDIVLFSDDDIIYDEGYVPKIIRAFRRRPKADLLLFNVRVNEKRRTYWNSREKNVHSFNCGRYPTFCCAARLDRLKEAGVEFSLLFGGGAPYANGEDSLFFMDCLRAGLKIRAVNVVIGYEKERTSTWFSGYDVKFFRDRGVLYAFLYRGWAELWAARFVLAKHKEMCKDIPPLDAFLLMHSGIKKGRQLCRG
ncbi:MAG: glycosyltransferase [Lachnospiraceae bacterium]|nr:glycosyltransferase [Lachnospiraceae bacterium]